MRSDSQLVRLYRAIGQVLDVPTESLTDEASPHTVSSWDSLNHLNLAMALESEFGVNLSAEEVLNIRSVALIRRILRQHGVEV